MLFTVRVAGCCRGLPADRKFGGRRAADIENRHYYSRGYCAAVRAVNFLESKRNKVGDTVSVKLLEAVSVADEVIIPKGTVLEGYLKKVQKGKLLSQKGVIRMRLKDYYLPNGYLLRLNNEEIKFSGDMNYTSLAAGVAVPFAGLAFKGKNVSCKPGMQFKYKLAHDVAVERY